MAKYYTDEKNVQVVIALLKEHGIRKVIVSPGATNVTLAASLQQDQYFEMYSSVDERSAAYMACGLAAESGEPVVISCTGATASRNYLPGLTEAYYRKLPILAITSTQNISKIGHHVAQVIDRSCPPKDSVNYSVTIPIIKDDDDLWECEIKVNKAILELKHRGGGPVHINLTTTYSRNYEVKELPKVRKIERIIVNDQFPELPKGKVAVFVGSHAKMDNAQIKIIDRFCASNDAVVFCDHSSNYMGKYRVLNSLSASQQMLDKSEIRPDLLIHIGEITGDYSIFSLGGKQVWRVNEDGEIRDTFRKLTYVFEMREQSFFEYYTNKNVNESDGYLHACINQYNRLCNKIPELPFSNLWVASKLAHRIPEGSTIHFGILNSLRSWNFFEIPNSVNSSSNVGGFGIDGGLSSLIGASLAKKDKLYFGVFGDLAFFYDLNSIGNRHVSNNLRILLINNGKGTEFRNFNHPGAQFGDEADNYIAAAGHFGNKSKLLVKNYTQNLGFEYIKADNKQEFDQVCERFLNSKITEKPILFEVFTNNSDESEALQKIMSLEVNIKIKVKRLTKQVFGNNTTKALSKFVK